MAAPTKYYEIEQCPHHEECNTKNFANWRPWGLSPEEAREQVVLHLLGSGLHKQHADEGSGRDRSYCEMLVTHCECVEKDWVPDLPKKTKGAPKHQPPSLDVTAQPATPPGSAASSAANAAVAQAQGVLGLVRPTQTVCQLSSMEYKAIIDACAR